MIFTVLIGLGFFHILGSTLVAASQFGVFCPLWAALFWLFWACWGLGKSHLVPFTGYYTLHRLLHGAVSSHRFLQPGAHRLVITVR